MLILLSVWILLAYARLSVRHAGVERTAVLTNGSVLTFAMRPAPATSAAVLTFAGSLKTYPACWLGPNSLVLVHLDTANRAYAFDLVPSNNRTCQKPSFENWTANFIPPTPLSFRPPAESKPDSASKLALPKYDEHVEPQETDDRGFLQKYWMYLLPVLLILMFGGEDKPAPNNPAPQ